MDNSVQDKLKKRRQYLESLRRIVIQRNAGAPEGSLRISRSQNRIQYYHRVCESDRNGKYILNQDRELVRQLAQKSYDEKILVFIQEELKAISAYEKYFPKIPVEEFFGTLPEERRDLIEPVVEADEMFLARWQDVPYKRKDFPLDSPELYTDRDERVRSKSEVIIANILLQEGIPYRYEYPVKLKGLGYVHPDFTVLNIRLRKEMYWEHLGMMDDPDYCRKAIRKINTYIRNGILPGSNLILSAETSAQPLNVRDIRVLIHRYLT